MNLVNTIIDLIKLKGPLPLDRFMNLVIPYYYENNITFGKFGDFVTAPEISQMFGEMIGVWCANHYLNKLNPNRRFNLIELGPGQGTLMKDLLRATKNVKEFHNNINRIYLLENSSFLQLKQKDNLAEYIEKIVWLNQLEEIDKTYPNLILANEFFDALPIKQYKKINNKFYEIAVGLINGRLEFVLLTNTTPLKEENCPEDGIIEVNTAASYFIKSLGKLIKVKGSKALFIDYGYVKPPYRSTLQALKKHSFHHSLKDIGHSDITSHVDFTNLQNNFEKLGLKTQIKSQEKFLYEQGIKMRTQTLINNSADKEVINSQFKRLCEVMGELFLTLEVYD